MSFEVLQTLAPTGDLVVPGNAILISTLILTLPAIWSVLATLTSIEILTLISISSAISTFSATWSVLATSSVISVIFPMHDPALGPF